MEKDRRKKIAIAGLALLALILCGMIGYINRAGTSLSTQAKTETALSGADHRLWYCSMPASICVVSFGQDSAGNMLIVLMNNRPETEIYARLVPSETGEIYSCQKVEFSPDTYYCVGHQVLEGTTITLEIYAKQGDMLLASGELPVQYGATPMVTPTWVVTATATKTKTPIPAYPNRTRPPSYP